MIKESTTHEFIPVPGKKRRTFIMYLRRCIVIMLTILLCSNLKGQDTYDPYGTLYYYLCIRQPYIIEEILPPVAVGCEIVDCCPGCPGPEILDWKIYAKGEAIQSLNFVFDELDPKISAKTEISGKAEWYKPNILTMKEGEVVVKGLQALKDGPVPVAFPTIELKKELFEEPPFDMDAPDEDPGSFDPHDFNREILIDIEAYLGELLVYEYSIVVVLEWCYPTQAIIGDAIDLNQNSADDDAVILFDGRFTSGCVNDQVYRTNDKVLIGNALGSGNCHSEIVVFSDDDAMQLHENVVWTNGNNDHYTVELTPDILAAPVSVWVMTNDVNNTVMNRAQAEIATAAQLYNSNNCGITFNANFADVSTNPQAVALVGTSTAPMCQSNWMNNLINSNFFNANQLNVYYVNGAFTGLNCIYEPNIIVIGTTATVETLAHEIGHAFSLDHTNFTAGIPAANLMVGGGANRTNITEGQAFRCNVDIGSALNTNGVRTGPTRNCPHGANSDDCPPVTFDVNPN